MLVDFPLGDTFRTDADVDVAPRTVNIVAFGACIGDEAITAVAICADGFVGGTLIAVDVRADPLAFAIDDLKPIVTQRADACIPIASLAVGVETERAGAVHHPIIVFAFRANAFIHWAFQTVIIAA